MTEVWSFGQRTPSPATVRRMVSWVTAVTWTGAGASASFSSFLEQEQRRRVASRRAAVISTRRRGEHRGNAENSLEIWGGRVWVGFGRGGSGGNDALARAGKEKAF